MATNHSRVLLDSAARTASPTIPDQANHQGRGVHVIIDVTAIADTPSITPTIQGYDPASQDYYDILVGSAITATGTTILKVYPGITPVANGSANDILPVRWRVVLTHADSDSITYSVGYNLVV